MQSKQSRRHFLTTVSAAGAGSLLGPRPVLANEAPLETTTIRLRRDPAICVAPWYIAEDLLRAEGFTDISYVPTSGGPSTGQMVGRGEIDFSLLFAATLVIAIDAGVPLTALAGVHPGCFELFAHAPIQTISDLKGKRVGIHRMGSGEHLYVAIMAAYVGLDPHKDIEWVASTTGNFLEMFAEGRVDALLAFPPEPQELRARKVGRVIIDTSTDLPWSQYFCCILFGNKNFVRAHPVATKRAMRAILKATDICAAEPNRAAQQLVKRGYTEHYDYALRTLTEVSYDRWREYDPEDALRFYALRLHEAGMISSTPNEIIAEGTDWRFLKELKRELKA